MSFCDQFLKALNVLLKVKIKLLLFLQQHFENVEQVSVKWFVFAALGGSRDSSLGYLSQGSNYAILPLAKGSLPL